MKQLFAGAASSGCQATINLRQLHQFARWHAMIAAPRFWCGRRTLYSEDMQHELRIDNMQS